MLRSMTNAAIAAAPSTVQFASVRLITNEVDRLVSFYELLTGTAATRLSPEFAEIRLAGATVAIGSERTVKQFNAGAAIAAANRSAIIEFQVADVDALRTRLGTAPVECVMPPTDMPWGNRSMLLRDPDGSLINVFSRLQR